MIRTDEFIDMFSEKTNRTKKESREIIYDVIALIKDALYQDGEALDLRNLCTFKMRKENGLKLYRCVHKDTGYGDECIGIPKPRISCVVSEKWKTHMMGNVSSYEEKPGQKPIKAKINQTIQKGYPEIDMFGIQREDEPIGLLKRPNLGIPCEILEID